MRLLRIHYGVSWNYEGKLAVLVSSVRNLRYMLTRFIVLLHSFISSSHTPTPNGKALYTALTASRINDKFQEPLYLAIELIRAGVLHSGKFGNRTWSGGPNLGDDSDKTNAMLVMRVLSIVPLNFKKESWTGPVSRSLLVFNSFLKTLSRSLRFLLESTSINMFLKNDANKKNREDFLEISLSLPFKSDINTGMGILWKGWCDACSHIGSQMGLGSREDLGGFASHVTTTNNTTSGQESSIHQQQQQQQPMSEEKKQSLEQVKAAVSGMLDGAFGNVRDVRHELARGVRFWDVVMVATRTLHQEGSLHEDLYQQFESANR